MPLFNFQLDPLEEIRPWAREGEPLNLHWFGLSCGHSWMDVGQQTLLEYTDAAVDEVGVDRYVDYQVDSFHGDIFDRARSILTPVPLSLSSYMHSPRFSHWADARNRWSELIIEPTAEQDRFMDLLNWPWPRKLDLLYLIEPPEIFIWTTESQAYVRWQTDTQRLNGVRVWSAKSGELTLTRDELIHEFQDFNRRYLDAMSERVREVSAGALPSVSIDIDMLHRTEKDMRRGSWSQILQPDTTADEWIEIEQAMMIVEQAGLH